MSWMEGSSSTASKVAPLNTAAQLLVSQHSMGPTGQHHSGRQPPNVRQDQCLVLTHQLKCRNVHNRQKCTKECKLRRKSTRTKSEARADHHYGPDSQQTTNKATAALPIVPSKRGTCLTTTAQLHIATHTASICRQFVTPSVKIETHHF